jgi:hypothetical protein
VQARREIGSWLEPAGFKPGNRVIVNISQPGKITLRFAKDGAGADKNSLQAQSTSSMVFGELL